MSSFGINKGFHHHRLTLTGLHHTIGRRNGKHTLTHVRILRLGEEVEVGIARTLIRHLQLTHSACFVLQIAEVDIVSTQSHLYRSLRALRLLQLAFHTKTGFLHSGLVIVFHTHSRQSEDGLVVTSAELENMIVGMHSDILRRSTLARAIQNTVTPSRCTTLLSLLLVVVGGVFLVLVGGRELDFRLNEFLEGETSTLRDLQLILLQQEVEIVVGVFKHLESGDIRGNTIVEIAQLGMSMMNMMDMIITQKTNW